MFKKVVLIVGVMSLCGGVALAVTYMYDDLAVVGPGGANPARIYIQQYDPTFGVPWTALKDSGLVPAELEIAPVPGQYDQATVKTQLAILGVGQYTPGDEVATPPFDARLLMSGPWPYSYVALRDDGSSPATLEINPLFEYRDIEATIKSTGDLRVKNDSAETLFTLDGGGAGGSFEADSTTARAVKGQATAASGSTFGGWFQSDSPSGIGMYGYASASSGETFGGYFQSSSTDGRGVCSTASASSGTTYGGKFVSGSSSGTGVYGYAFATSGTTYGVRGKVNSADGYAGYFEGGKGVYADDIEWAPKTGYIMVNANEYVPMYGGYSYRRTSVGVANQAGSNQYWYAPLQLPHGSTITYIEWYYYDLDPGQDVWLDLYRVDGSSIVNLMATGSSSGSPGYGSVSTTSISSPTVDNTQYSYALRGETLSTDHALCQISIHYTYSEPY